jgi:hypothetical protein
MNAAPKFIIQDADYNQSVPFIVLFAATPSHQGMANRLKDSVKKLGLPFISLQVPTIHKSVSPKGSDDIRYCKANLIAHILNDKNRPILYIDSDCVVESYPFLIEYLSAEAYDFAIFNWLNLESNQAYVRDESEETDSQTYKFSHSIDYISRTQLICSGAVQYWGYSNISLQLLSKWMDCVENNPNSPDDHSLDYAYNNLEEPLGIKSYWLPKAYARYAWWVFDKPVINHPDYPNPGLGFTSLTVFNGKPRIHVEQLSPRILNGNEQFFKTNKFILSLDGTVRMR